MQSCYIMKEDTRMKYDEETVPVSPEGDEGPARGLSDELVDGDTVDIAEKSDKVSKHPAE
jgi:hypothetical protein